MRNTKLHTICILALSSILTIGFEAHAQLDPNMEASAGCTVDCFFDGNPQTRDAIRGFEKLPTGGARLMKVNRYTDNPDQELDRKVERQFNPIGQVETIKTITNSKGQEGNGVATAFLVSPCYVLTNNHAVFGNDFPAQPKNEAERAAVGAEYKMKFKVNVGKSLPFATGTYATPVAWGDRNASNKNDWALLKLSSCLGERAEIGWMELDVNHSSEGLNGRDVAVASYPSDRGSASTSDAGQALRLSWGKVTGYNRDNDTVRYSASTAPGSSGGVVTITDKDGNVRVIGMHRGGLRNANNPENYKFDSYSDRYSNEFLNIRDVIESQDVQRKLLDDVNRFNQTNPNIPNLRRGIPAKQSGSMA